MPLRDHFRPPVDDFTSWDVLHGQWPATIVSQLRQKLPAGFISGPSVHLGNQCEVDVATFDTDEYRSTFDTSEGSGGVATATWSATEPAVAVETFLPDYDEYEVRIYDAKRGRRLVAAIEIVSPANKDRPESRNAFIGKCAALIQKGVAVSIVDLVTVRQFNLYAELLEFIGHRDPTLGDPLPHLYAASCRYRVKDKRMLLEAWSHVMTLGQPLPTLPLWLTPSYAVALNLEESYEKACYDLSIT